MAGRITYQYKFHRSVKNLITKRRKIKKCDASCRCTLEDGCWKVHDKKGCPPKCKNCKNQHFQPREKSKETENSNTTPKDEEDQEEDDYEMDLEVKDCGAKGKGLFTKKLLKKGIPVIAYIGEVISKEEEEIRKAKYISQGIIPNMFGSGQFTIDATVYGNDARYANHSCKPNMVAVRHSVHRGPGNFKGILMSTNDVIKADTELTFNYGEYYTEDMVCQCGAEECAGIIGKEPKDLSKTERAQIADPQVVDQIPEAVMNNEPSNTRVLRKRPAAASTSEVDKKRVCRATRAGSSVKSYATTTASTSKARSSKPRNFKATTRKQKA